MNNETEREKHGTEELIGPDHEEQRVLGGWVRPPQEKYMNMKLHYLEISQMHNLVCGHTMALTHLKLQARFMNC